ncbi:hypothetical protein LTR95_014464 [Oleoguttula sp. CCFEE 5521]
MQHHEEEMEALTSHAGAYKPVMMADDANSINPSIEPPRTRRTFASSLSDGRRGFFDSWKPEFLSLVLSLAAFAALIAFLLVYHDKPLASFGNSTSINAIISVLITISEFSMLFPVSEALCQQKWIHMNSVQTLGAPLSDLQRFDWASKSGLAALRLIGNGRAYGATALLGATAMILHLFIGPFAQQAVSYPVYAAAVKYPYPNATISSTHDWISTPFSLSIVAQAAVDAPWTGSTSLPKYACSSANCTWDRFETLGVCSKCVDVSAQVQEKCADPSQSPCDVQFPSGNIVGGRDGSYTYATFWNDSCATTSYNISATPSNDSLTGATNWQQNSCSFHQKHGANLGDITLPFAALELYQSTLDLAAPVALDCALYVCVESVANAAVTNGTFSPGNATSENSLSATYDTRYTQPPSNIPIELGTGITLTSTRSSNSYIVNSTALGDVSGAIMSLFTQPGSGSAIRTPLFARSYSQWSTLHWTLADFKSGYPALPANILDSVSTAVSNSMRSERMADSFESLVVTGTTWSNATYIHVRWLYLIYPAVVIVLAASFVLGTAIQTKRSKVPVWKSSTLATVYHGHVMRDRDVDRIGEIDRISGMERDARDRLVRLGRVDSGRLMLVPVAELEG